MFPLTRPMRQGLATVALIALTVVPTALISLYAWRINRPGHIRDVEIELGRQLGLQVSLEGVTYPRPGEMIFQGIVLRQEETRGKGLTEIARAKVVRVVRTAREVTLHADDLKLSGESPSQALAQVGELLQRSGSIPYDRIELAAPSCELDLDGQGFQFTIQDVAGEFVIDPTNPTLRMAYRIIEPDGGSRCELTLNRNRGVDPVESSIVMKTIEGSPLPSRVLDVFFPSGEWLGAAAKVDGTLALKQVGNRPWEAEFSGNLLNVDLQTLVRNRFHHHHLVGTARIGLQSARWGDRPGQGPGWREIKGDLLVGQGTIGLDLLNALGREMKFRLSSRAARLDPRKPEVEFVSLGLAFDMRSDGEIHLKGGLGNEFSPDTVLANASAPLMMAPDGSASVHGLIKTLFPLANRSPGIMVPLTSESRVLLCLPVPPEVASAGRTMDAN